MEVSERDPERAGVVWRFKFLGRFQATHNRTEVEASSWGRRRTLSLLKLLLTEPGKLFTQDELIDALFHDLDPHKAIPNLQARISELRRILEPDLSRSQSSAYIETIHGTHYRFKTSAPYQLDVEDVKGQFDRAHEHYALGNWQSAYDDFEEALSRSSLEFLPEDRYEDWAIPASSQWREHFLDAQSAFAHCAARLNNMHVAIDTANSVILQEPYRERAYREKMLYAYLLGERQIAQTTYQKCTQIFRNELGVLPSHESRALHERIMQGDKLTLDTLAFGLDLRSIAVLPLVNLSGDPEHEYFSDGLTEDIIRQIAHMKNVRVIARTSAMRFKSRNLSLSEIGRELKVSTVLEGSVRWAPDKVRIGVQLIRTDSETHLWSETFDREFTDIFEIQSEVARRIAEALKVQIGSQDLTEEKPVPTRNIEAYHHYLKGRHFLNKRTERDFNRAIAHFESALNIDGLYARAVAGLADAHGLLAWFSYGPMDIHFPKSRDFAERALDLDGTLSEAYTALGYYYLNYQWDWQSSLNSFEKSLELNSNHVPARHWYAELLAVLGRTEDAVRQLEFARSVDPLSPLVHAILGWINYFHRDFSSAEQNCLDSIELDPNFNTAHWILGQVYVQQQRYSEAIVSFKTARELSSDHPSILGLQGLAHAKLGETVAAHELRDQIKNIKISGEPNFIGLATVNIGLGEFEKAVELLTQAYEKRAWFVPFFSVEPMYDAVVNCDGFRKILIKLGLKRHVMV